MDRTVLTSEPSQFFPKLPRPARPGPRFLLGNFGKHDLWIGRRGTYKADERFGLRFGKVRNPSGSSSRHPGTSIPLHMVVMRRAFTPCSSRNRISGALWRSRLRAHQRGGKFGKLDTRFEGGERQIPPTMANAGQSGRGGFCAPNGSGGETMASYPMENPVPGLMIGASDGKEPCVERQNHAGNGALTENGQLLL